MPSATLRVRRNGNHYGAAVVLQGMHVVIPASGARARWVALLGGRREFEQVSLLCSRLEDGAGGKLDDRMSYETG